MSAGGARTRRLALTGLALLALAGPLRAAEGTGTPPAPAPKPNIVVILIDALRADHLSFYGYSKETAPFLARLAREGIVFENAFTAAPSTAPSTASLFTSLLPEQHGVITGRFGIAHKRFVEGQTITLHKIPEKLPILGEIMKRAGYETMAVADNKNVSEPMGFARGFDLFSSDNPSATGAERINAILREWKSRAGAAGSYFLYVHYIDPHQPYHSRQPWVTPEGPGMKAFTIARYDSEITYVDQKIEEMYRLFGWDKNTLLVVLADHGEEFWDHGGTSHGKSLFGEVLRVPLLFHDSGRSWPAGRIADTVSTLDILPTLMDYAGLPAEKLHRGTSLLPAIRKGGDPSLSARYLFAHVDNVLPPKAELEPAGEPGDSPREEGEEPSQGGLVRPEPVKLVARAVIHANWKLISDSQRGDMLFDMAADPGETKNLVETAPAVAADLRAKLAELLQTMPRFSADVIEEELSPEELEKLRSLGYVH